MFKKGDLVLYSVHGICEIDDICEKTFSYEKREYYTLHPIKEEKLTISIPVDSDKISILELLSKEEAQDVVESFKDSSLGTEWITIDKERGDTYSNVVRYGKREEVIKVANTLMRTKIDLESQGKKFHEKDKKILEDIQKVLFSELAFSLEISCDEVKKAINKNVKEEKIS